MVQLLQTLPVGPVLHDYLMQAKEYQKKILSAVPPDTIFEPLMTLYLTDDTSPDDVQEAKAAGILAYKLYPAGATTNSQSGVTNIEKCLPALHAMQEVDAFYKRICTCHLYLLPKFVSSWIF